MIFLLLVGCGNEAVPPKPIECKPTTEQCNGLDDDCDGQIDEEAMDSVMAYQDKDGDSFGDIQSGVQHCLEAGWVQDGTDCKDDDANIFPGQTEIRWDGIDQDCDGQDRDCSDAGTVLSGDVDIYTESDRQALCAQGVGIIDGDLQLCADTDSDLAGLECLCEVTGTVFIACSPGPVRLNGLDNLSRVGELFIGANPEVTHLEGLEGLHSIDTLSLFVATGLQDISVLKGVHGHLSRLSLSGLTALETIDGLQNVTSIGTLQIDNLPKLTSVEGLSSLETLDLLWIHDAPQLRSLVGFASLSQLGGVDLEENARLEDISQLPDITTVATTLKVVDNPFLTDIHLFSQVETAEEVVIGGNAIDDLGALSQLRQASFLFLGEAGVADLQSLSQLQHVDFLMLQGLQVQDLAGLEGLQGTVYQLSIQENDQMEDISALAGIQAASLTICGNASIKHLGGLQGSVGGLYEVVQICDNPQLENLTGLEGLVELGYLEITNNTLLSDISALQNLAHVNMYAMITDNPALPTQAAEAFCGQLEENNMNCWFYGNGP